MSETAREREGFRLGTLDVDLETGLSGAEVLRRRTGHGLNILVPEQRPSSWRRVVRPLFEPMALLLLAAGIVYLLLGDRGDAAIMLIALIPIVGVDYVLEERAQRTLAGLKRLVARQATVRRDGQRQRIPVDELVPGDIVLVQEGDIVGADGILVSGSDIRVDESSLTGESLPAAKEPARRKTPANVLLAGTTLLSGRGTMIVTATGQHTEYGRIGSLVSVASPRPTPTQRAITNMVRSLGTAAVAALILVVGIELARHTGLTNALSAGVSLAIAVIPEEFPVVFTLYLTLGAWRMARRKALVRRIAGVETLGSISVICADKTGTLTEGRMAVTAAVPTVGAAPDGQAMRHLVEVAILASEPQPYDPLEQSLVSYGVQADVDVRDLYSRLQLVEEYPFEAHRKCVSHLWRERGGALRLCSKGPVEVMLALSDAADLIGKAALLENERLANSGMRVLAVAEKHLDRFTGNRQIDESNMTLLGLVGFTDPPREGVRDAIHECQAAGVRVVMITGDHPLTAHNMAEAIGLRHDDDHILTGDDLDSLDDQALGRLMPNAAIFARISPAQKHRIVRVLKNIGATVAMTGDGINDAPALREADVGVAMGQRGTEVAREAATMVLLDDNFRTIVAALREGRRIYDNLRHVFSYLIAFHVPILLPALIVPLVGAPLLLLPAHLVWLELILHPTASLVFEADPPAPDLMQRPPRPPNQAFLSARMALFSLTEGLLIAVAVLSLYFIGLRYWPHGEARGAAMVTLVIAQMTLVLMERSPERPLWEINTQENKFLLPIMGAALGSLALFLYVPPLAAAFGFAPLSAVQVGIATIVALACTLPMEIRKYAPHGK